MKNTYAYEAYVFALKTLQLVDPTFKSLKSFEFPKSSLVL